MERRRCLNLLMMISLVAGCGSHSGGKTDVDTVDTAALDTATIDSDTADDDTVDSESVDTGASDTGTSNVDTGTEDVDTQDTGSSTVDSDTVDTATAESDTVDTDTADTDTVDTDTEDSDTSDSDTAPAPELVWISIPGGNFNMGSTTQTDEQPVHNVTVPAFEMLQTEVTVAQYAACLGAGACTQEPLSPHGGEDYYNWGDEGFENHPVNAVSWYAAGAFCAWVGGRLPSEAEWEYAARSAGQDILYPWGDEGATCEYAVMDGVTTFGCDTGRTMEVCSRPAGNTEQGLCDMAGNVWEWVQDVYHGTYDCDANTSALYCPSGGVAPNDASAWEGVGSYRSMRGNSFAYSYDLRTTSRAFAAPADRDGLIGFRCAR